MPTAAILPAARDRRHLRLPIVLALLCTLLPVVPAAAQTRYVTDQLEITLRAGAGNGYRIVAMLPSGERLQVLEQNEEWTRVRTGEGRQGWVLSRYLSQTPAARATLDQLRETLARESDRAEAAAGELAAARAQLTAQAQTLAEQQARQAQLEQQLAQAGEGLAMADANAALEAELAAQREELQALRQERDALQAREARQWFLLGASVLGAGIVLGLVLPRLRWRRKRNDWGSW